MYKILVVTLIISLFFIEGCTVIGYSIGKGIQIKNSLEIENIESIEENLWLTISMKNNEIIKGQFISCINDTLFVTYQSPTNFTPISNNQFLSISSNRILYKIPVDQIKDIQIRKVDFRVVGTILGIVVDFFSLLIILMIQKGPVAPSGDFLG